MDINPVSHNLNEQLQKRFGTCIIFPADGSEIRRVEITTGDITVGEITAMASYGRCTDATSTFNDESRKARIIMARDSAQGAHLVFYNLSPNLPINLNVARIIGLTSSHLKLKKRLFWRGDVATMKVQPEGDQLNFIVENSDTDLPDLRPLEKFFRRMYQAGAFERLLHEEELKWLSSIPRFHWPTSLWSGAQRLFWSRNAVKKEEKFLNDLNELRCAIGRYPLPPHVYMKSYAENAVTLYSVAKYAFGLQNVTGPPKLPPELERLIFEMCALDSPEFCTVLVLVTKRVYAWIDPLLMTTIVIKDVGSLLEQWERLRQFLAKLTNGKPVEYYAQHVKNLAIFGAFSQHEVINRILTICTGVENLLLLGTDEGFDLLENPHAGRNLRRLCIELQRFFPPGSTPTFYHPCFANLTHLHLCDAENKWPTYVGWEALTSLTHLAFYFAEPEEITRVIQMLPAIRYVAIGHYDDSEIYRYAHATVNNSAQVREIWGAQVVFLSRIPQNDWERGTRGEGDFWDLVEQVEKWRLEAESVG